eukprot:m.378947 g.378947  ORF g.378947 m.378947 type:complete len:391 (-) comp56209_c0_seq3:120-1292(-)
MIVLAVVCCMLVLCGTGAVGVVPRPLPATVLAAYPGSAYTTDGTADPAVLEAARTGVNVIIWNDVVLVSDEQTGAPMVELAGITLSCVAATAKQLIAENLQTTHLVSIGGWGAPHPATANPITGASYTAAEVYNAWATWNNATAREYDWNGFDGMDWDMEGANEASSPENYFTAACLDLVGQLSQLAKADGFVISLVPCESYFDPTTGNFSQSLLFPYPEWKNVDFYYHGRNPYAYLVARYGQAMQNQQSVNTFDFVTIGLYESYSHADYNITVLGVPAAEYLNDFVPRLIRGWLVQFADEPDMNFPSQWVSLNQTQVVLGLANGWAGDAESLLIYPSAVGQAWTLLAQQGITPRGVAFWDIGDEGRVPVGQTAPLYLTPGLNEFLHTRS